jgi:hypothetical protein
MSYQRVTTNIIEFEMRMWPMIMEIIRYRSNELLAWTRMRFLSHKSSISVRTKTGRLANSGLVVQPYRRGLRVWGGVRYNARDPVSGYNYARSHFRLPGQPAMVVITPKNKQALAIPIEGAGSSYGGNTFAAKGMLFVRNSFDPFDFTPVAILKQRVIYPRRIDVEGVIYPYIIPKIQADIAYMVNTWSPGK